VRVHAVPGPAQPGLNPAARAYDAIAAGYDAQVAGDDWMREVLHAHYLRVFRPGQRLLDVGCGTGVDALFLAQHGMRVVGVDVSSEMISQARLRLAAQPGAQVGVLAIQDLGQLEGSFDGLISAFAGLSALPDLHGFASDAARLVKPGGRLVLHALNRFSLWEWLGYVSHRDWSAARQVGRLRSREFTIGGQVVQHRVYFADEAYREFFAPSFALRGAYALGSLRPPHTVHRLPGSLVGGLEWLDVRLGAWPLLDKAGRFWVLDLQRLPT
jgi:ubiquinone/menaquinone biosynthesis C-methylase UbiE